MTNQPRTKTDEFLPSDLWDMVELPAQEAVPVPELFGMLEVVDLPAPPAPTPELPVNDLGVGLRATERRLYYSSMIVMGAGLAVAITGILLSSHVTFAVGSMLMGAGIGLLIACNAVLGITRSRQRPD